MNSIDSHCIGNIELLNEAEVDQVGGAVAPLVMYAVWMGIGGALGFGAAAVVHYFGNGDHAHSE